MKKGLLLLAAALFAFAAVNAQTDDKSGKKERKTSKVGSFLKKTVEASTGLNVSDEVYITMENKRLNDKIDLGFVGCYGDSKTGDVYMVVTAKMKTDRIKVYINTENAATAKGKMYNTGSNCSTVDVEYAKNIAVEVNMEKRPLLNVPTSVKQLEDVKLRVQIGGDSDYYHLHNVAVQWDVKPE
ncbi:MAG: hypothetical protein J6M30_07155 [Bacteroidales bacterium]|nr:hypothetical protein [Bacteroidales bacterium]